MSRQMLWRVLVLAGMLGCGVALLSEVSGQDSKPDPSKAPPGAAPKAPGDTPKSPPSTPPGGGAPTTGAPGAPPKVAQGQPAMVNLQCPDIATIWIEGQKMTSTGPVRSFQSPPLEAGKVFYYTFKVSWPGAPGQKDTVVEQEVTVRGGQTTVLDFRPQGTFGPPMMTQPGTVPRYSRPGIVRPEGSRRRGDP